MNSTGKAQISYREAVSILVVTSVFSTITFSLQSSYALSPLGYMIAFGLGVVFNFLLITPLFLLLKRYPRMSVLDCSYRILGKISLLFTGALFVFLIFVASKTIAEFNTFLLDSVFPQGSTFAIVILMCIACGYGAFLGIEALGRFANMVFILTVISVVLVTVALFGNIEWLNFGRFEVSKLADIVRQSFSYATSNAELITVLLLTPFINKKVYKGYIWWNLCALLLVEAISVSVFGTLGELAQNKPYPYYDVTTIAEMSILKRLDVAHLCIWVLVAFVKVCYYLLLAKNVLDRAIRKFSKKYSLLVSSFLLFFLSIIWSLNTAFSKQLAKVLISPYVVLSIVVGVPLLLWILSLCKGDSIRVDS